MEQAAHTRDWNEGAFHRATGAPVHDLTDFAPGANLAGRDLRGADLSGMDLEGANLSECLLSGAQLFKTRLRGANLSRADLSGAELSAADLTEAHLEDTNAAQAGFGMATMHGARLFNARLEGATLSKADLTGADLRCVEAEGARFREAVLDRADFTSARLNGADLSKSSVTGASFRNALIREARLRSVRGFEKADWIGVDIHNINFAGAYRLRRFVIDQNYLMEFRQSGPIHKWWYWIWWITSDCGRSLTRWGMWIVLLTLIFAWIYSLVGVDFGDHPTWLSPYYYSVVTFTTLGYGDVVPMTPAAQTVAMVEVFFGYVMLGGLLSIFSNIIARRGD